MKNDGSSKTDTKDIEKSNKDALAPVSYFRLFRYATPFDIFLDVVGMVAAMAAGAAQPMLALLFGTLSQNFISFATTVKQFQDGLASEADVRNAARGFRDDASRNAVYFVIAGIVVLLCTFLYMYTWTYTGEVNSKRIREHYLQAILRQDVEYFDQVGAGEVATRIQSDTHLVQQGISEKVAMAAHFSAAFIVGFILAFTQSWRLALAMTSMLPALMLTGALMGRFMTRYTQISSDRLASAGTIAEESISTIRTAKAFGVQFHIGALFDDKVVQAGHSDVRLAIAQGSGFAAFFFINYAAYGLAFSFGTTLLNRGLINAGQVITVFMSIFIGSFSLTVIAPEVIAITTARGAAAKLFATIDRVPAIDSSSPSGIKPESVAGDIVLEHVTFTYPSRPDVTVLQDISMTFSAGKSFALVGPSGSGKSTIISLIERFYDPTNGAIKLDKNDLKSVNVKWLRRQIGLVSQEPVLFGTSVTNNVAFGLIGTPYEFAPEEEKFELIKQACIKANAHDFISRLPKGYDTTVGERGFLLSGGQKQRVAIARAIVSDPSILLLDEATSALDTQSEEVVQDALSKASEGRTTITIAHRLSTIKNADKIYVMSEGKIVEEGSHEELMNTRGVYSRLVEAQGLKAHIGGTPTPVGTSTPMPQTAEDSEKGALKAEILMEEMKSFVMEKTTPDSTTEKKYSITYLAKRMGVLAKDKWKNFFLGFLFSIAAGLVYPAFGVVYAFSINGFAQPDPRERRIQGDRNALWFFIIAVLSGFTMGGQNYCLSSAAATLAARLRKLSFRAILRQDVEFFDKETNTSGVLTSRITGDPGKINGFAGITLGTIIQSLTTVLAGIIAGVAIVWQIGLVGMACTPILLSAGYSRLHAVMLKDAKNKEAHAQSAQIACESAGAIRTVAALTREDACLAEYMDSLAEPLRHAIRTGALSMFLYSFCQAAMFFVMALVFWLGAVLFSRLEITVFQLFVGLMSTTLGALQAGGMFQFAPDMSAAKDAASNIITLFDSPSSIESEADSGEKQPCVQGRIEAKDVYFNYPSRPNLPVLKGINFTAETGQYIAFVGASGSGKSTIIQLLQRFYDIKSGSIHIDDSSLKELNLAAYRKDVALVSQEPTLYSGTIKFNILLGATKPHSEVTQSELEEACRKANILEFITGLPEGFETEVGNKGSQLSGGQKRKLSFSDSLSIKSYPLLIPERIAIARALIRNPKILLLDEATSALDSASEKVVQVALDQAAKGRTTIAIAHRLSTIQDADKIYFIKHGRVSESGTHNELLSLQGDYYDYVQLQTLQQDT